MAAPEAQSGDSQQLLLSEAAMQDWCPFPWDPATGAAGSFGQAQFVDEDGYSVLPNSIFFFISDPPFLLVGTNSSIVALECWRAGTLSVSRELLQLPRTTGLREVHIDAAQRLHLARES